MFQLGFQFHHGAIHLPAARLWLDAHHPVGPGETAFVSHAHSDHTARHSRVLFSAPTQRLMRARVAGEREEFVLEFGRQYDGESLNLGLQKITLLPAGHIFGSAMSLLEDESGSLLYTGDFKLRPSLSAEPCEPRRADVLIMETTFGRPEYVFPPTNEVLAGIGHFCREALDNDEIPVLLGYSLGKSQEVLAGLARFGLRLMLSEPVARLTRIYQQMGHSFPPYAPFDPKSAAGHVVLAPPGSTTASLRRQLGDCRVAVLTGWAVSPDCLFRYHADAAFPLSDHADFPDLVEFVRQVAPRHVFTLHGFAADFAAHLRQLGFDARALGLEEQLDLPRLGGIPLAPVRAPGPVANPPIEGTAPAEPTHLREAAEAPPESFQRFAQTCEAIVQVRSKLEKCRLLAKYLARLEPAVLSSVVGWFTGSPFPSPAQQSLSLNGSVLRSALCTAAEVTVTSFRQVCLRENDPGATAAALLSVPHRTRIGPRLTLIDVQKLFDQLHQTQGPTGKQPLLCAALTRCTPEEARYLVKLITGNLRLGLKEGLVENAVAETFSVSVDDLRAAHQLVGDLGETACLALQGRLREVGLAPFRPFRVMLASPEPDTVAILARVAEWTAPSNSTGPSSIWLEDKYDGLRCQLHHVGQRVAFFGRDLTDLTGAFPELAAAARRLPDVILDGEVVALDGDRFRPVGELPRRRGRREDDLFPGQEISIRFVAFDLLWHGGIDVMNQPLARRRALLESLDLPKEFRRSFVVKVSAAAEIDAAYANAQSHGREGLMIKDPAAPYTPGQRGFSWLKLKRAFVTLDCVVVGAEFGRGSRPGVLGNCTIALRDERTQELVRIGKVHPGLNTEEIARLTSHLLSRVGRQKGRFYEVEPDLVLEIAFETIQLKTRRNSRISLGSPRIVRIREDKTAAEIDTLSTARRLAKLPE